MKSVIKQNLKIYSKLEEFFEYIVDNKNIDEYGKFQINYRSDNERGKWIVGRNESNEGLDYVYRQRFNNRDTESNKVYLYSDKYGWCNIGLLLGQEEIILGLAQWVDLHLNNKKDYESKLEKEFDNIRSELQNYRNNLVLNDIITAIKSYDFNFLRDYVAPEGDDAAEFWKLLYSYDKNNDIIENDISIEYKDENIFFVRSIRQYINNNSKKIYPMGLVIGYDDTPDSFFVHRIERDDDLDNDNFTWNLNTVRNKMGFDIDYTDLKTNEIPINCRTRLQGNLCVVPYDYNYEKNKYYEKVISELKLFSYCIYKKLYYINELNIDDIYNLNNLLYHRGSNISIKGKPSTDELKNLQAKLNISEKEVRKEQKSRNIKRLSANLRGKIIIDIHIDKFCDWLFNDCVISLRKKYENNLNRNYEHVALNFDITEICNKFNENAFNYKSEITRSTIHKLAEKEVNKTFNPQEQCNIIFGNHSVMFGLGQIHPSSTSIDVFDNLSLEKVIVPEKTTVILGHDEHKSRIYTFPRGVYEFRFLDGLNTDLFN